jgi:hypothetical protein
MGEAKRRQAAHARGIGGFSNTSVVIGDDGLISSLCGLVIENLEARRSATEALRAMTAAALAMQGMAAMDSPMEHAAAHEAGHCVVAARLGYRLESASIGQEAGGWRGWTAWGAGAWIIDRTTQPESDWRGAAVMIAGLLAENIMVDHIRFGSSLDETVAHGLICSMIARKLGPPDHSPRIDQRIVGLISNATVLNILNDRRPALERIAAALILRRALDAHELQDLLADVPDRSEELTRQFFTNVEAVGCDPRLPAALDALMERPDSVAFAMQRLGEAPGEEHS